VDHRKPPDDLTIPLFSFLCPDKHAKRPPQSGAVQVPFWEGSRATQNAHILKLCLANMRHNQVVEREIWIVCLIRAKKCLPCVVRV